MIKYNEYIENKLTKNELLYLKNLKDKYINTLNENNTSNHAEFEFKILSKVLDPINKPLVIEFKDEIINLVRKFGDSGQSGGSAPYVAGAITDAVKKLLLQQPISPITGEDDEWVSVSNFFNDNETLQNKRCYALFKEKDIPYYLDAIIFVDDDDLQFTSNSVLLSNGSKIGSRQKIKSFPFEPKSFYIDVIRKDISSDNYENYVKDENQLDDVWNYYDKL